MRPTLSPGPLADLAGLVVVNTAGKPKPGGRPYRKRYVGILRQIARNNGMHPIRDREAIAEYMARTLALAKQLHRQHPKYKYRNMEITENGVRGVWQTAGPTM